MFSPFRPPAPQLSLCGCFVMLEHDRQFLPLINVNAHAVVLSASSSTTLTQTFRNPDSKSPLKEVRYDFPLYDGVTVVGFTCTVGDRKIRAVAKERQAAKKTYEDAADRGETAALLEQELRASDVFTATVGNVPAGDTVKVEITYLGELEHDAQADAVRLTIPTAIAPRYGGGQVLGNAPHGTVPTVADGGGGISITVDAEMALGCPINNVHSPSHPISVSIGSVSTATGAPSSPQRASATLALGTARLEKDFVLMIGADGLGSPAAMVETHPDLQRRALMATLVPRFTLPVNKPEVVFVCDRSGSMGDGQQMPNLIAALQIFLKSLPVGVKYNICSFGSKFDFLWQYSQPYDQASLDQAVRHVKSFQSDYGGTEIHQPLEAVFKRRLANMNLEVFLLTDGEIWDQEAVFEMVRHHVAESKGAIRVFTVGIGEGASSALVQGVARAGNGFAQMVAEDEKIDKKVVRMLKGALTPHVADYALEIEYDESSIGRDVAQDEDYELVESVDCHAIDAQRDEATTSKTSAPETRDKPILLYDPDVRNDEMEMADASTSDDSMPSKLPEVTPPRYLQAPMEIPALFPFNRLTVYVLLPESTARREIKSVVLTGKSSHGPLRLEVPVTKLAGTGTTIHQLAARKAVQELQDNGGWVARAKSSSGKLLREEYAAHIDAMVKREAVRLGVEYQVGGKWCSFVAVNETRPDGTADAESDTETLGACDVVHAEDAQTFRPYARRSYGGAPQPRVMMCMAAAPSMAMKASFSPGSAGASCVSAAPPPMAMAAAGPDAGYGGDDDDDEDVGFGFFDDGGPPPPPPAPFGGGRGGGRGGRGGASLFGGGRGGSRVLMSRFDSDAGEDDCQDQPMMDVDDDLSRLASLQTFAGSWSWCPELEQALGVTQKMASEMRLSTHDVGQADRLATLCTVVFLRTRLAHQRDAWEMLVEKAEAWLEEQTGETAAKLEKMVEDAGLFAAAKE